MKTQKLTLAAVLATTLLSTSAFADIDNVAEGGKTTAEINLTLAISKVCSIKGLSSTQDQSLDEHGVMTISSIYADCNGATGLAPQISFSSTQLDSGNFYLKGAGTNTVKIPYTVEFNNQVISSGVSVNMPSKDTGKAELKVKAAIGIAPADTYTATLTATITI